MQFSVLLLVAIGLSFDSFAVSVSSGFVLPKIKFIQACKIALSLAITQALMTGLGWFVGSQVRVYIEFIDHWIAFVLLLILGGKMIFESLNAKDEVECFNPLKWTVLLTMSLATSIDALAMGVGFALLRINIFYSSFVIGSVTYAVSMIGIFFGQKTGNKMGKKMEIVGGIILILIGIKILLEHLLA
jgi:manganese efflux pump family protein